MRTWLVGRANLQLHKVRAVVIALRAYGWLARAYAPSVLSTFFQLSSPPITSSTSFRVRCVCDVTWRSIGNSNGHVGHVHLFAPVLTDGSTVTTFAQFGQKSMWNEVDFCAKIIIMHHVVMYAMSNR